MWAVRRGSRWEEARGLQTSLGPRSLCPLREASDTDGSTSV